MTTTDTQKFRTGEWVMIAGLDIMAGKSTRYRYRVVESATGVTDVLVHVRPSRGYARHVRRVKQRERKP